MDSDHSEAINVGPQLILRRLSPLFENDPEGVTFEQPVRGTKPFSGADETTLKQRAGYPYLQQAGDGQNAVFLRIDLEPVT